MPFLILETTINCCSYITFYTIITCIFLTITALLFQQYLCIYIPYLSLTQIIQSPNSYPSPKEKKKFKENSKEKQIRIYTHQNINFLQLHHPWSLSQINQRSRTLLASEPHIKQYHIETLMQHLNQSLTQLRKPT